MFVKLLNTVNHPTTCEIVIEIFTEHQIDPVY